ncbi:hypothetical protein B0H63DRAFT_469781 [Podospora didyma]|uniref:Tetraspanin n=1 Tax=Podospora didyma TaxID=330526 RepID=A0AAE0NTB6_9PEZI|nr:hypothetical protein B0H63DRAFT_469781 [Podospora didyma]
MALTWLALYPLAILALAGVAIYEHIQTVHLSLPVSPVLTFMTILLPLLAAINTLSLPSLLQRAKSSASHYLLPVALQAGSLILTTILGTLLATDAIPSPVRECVLESKWKHLWQSHDGDHIRRIQDALDCCGFRTVKDMAWPFPVGSHPDDAVSCVARFGRTAACKAPWEEALQRATGVDLAVVLAVAVLQGVGLLLTKVLASSRNGDNEPWWRRVLGWWFTRLGGGGDGDLEGRRRRPLLVGMMGSGADGVEEVGDSDDEAYRGGDGQRRRGTNGYGGTGPRVEPSHEDPWRANE